MEFKSTCPSQSNCKSEICFIYVLEGDNIKFKLVFQELVLNTHSMNKVQITANDSTSSSALFNKSYCWLMALTQLIWKLHQNSIKFGMTSHLDVSLQSDVIAVFLSNLVFRDVCQFLGRYQYYFKVFIAFSKWF